MDIFKNVLLKIQAMEMDPEKDSKTTTSTIMTFYQGNLVFNILPFPMLYTSPIATTY